MLDDIGNANIRQPEIERAERSQIDSCHVMLHSDSITC
jgi:hypothetical protein